VCGRYTLATPDHLGLRSRFGLDERLELRRRFNVAPGDHVVAVTTDREGRPRGDTLRWGLVPHWADDPKVGARHDQRARRRGSPSARRFATPSPRGAA
jgi:putative SOS response-associated peptidase YedK